VTTIQHLNALQETNGGYYFMERGRLFGPHANWKPIPENNTQPAIVPHSVILHTNAGSKPATWLNLHAWVSRADVTGEPHFQVDNLGHIGQFMSIERRADCNYSANSWRTSDGSLHGAISIETGDLGAATVETTPWNLPQVAAIIGICTAAAVQYGTGCNEVLKWDGHGIDYHTKFPYQGLTKPAWTNVRGKTCPGAARKLQTPYIRQQVAERVGAYINECRKRGIPHGIKGID